MTPEENESERQQWERDLASAKADPAGFFATQPPPIEPRHRVQGLRHWPGIARYEIECYCGAVRYGPNPFEAIDDYARHRVASALLELGVRPEPAPVQWPPMSPDPTPS